MESPLHSDRTFGGAILPHMRVAPTLGVLRPAQVEKAAQKACRDRRHAKAHFESIPGITGDEIKGLRLAKVKVPDTLLSQAKTAKDREVLAEKTGLSAERLLELANRVNLMRVRGVGHDYAWLLRDLDITAKELRNRNPERLAKAINTANERCKRADQPVTTVRVATWIAAARTLHISIEY